MTRKVEHTWHETGLFNEEEARSYWTSERMGGATPIPLPVHNDRVPSEGDSEHGSSKGPPIFIQPDNLLHTDATPVPNTQVWPYTTIGKVFGDWIDQNNGLHQVQGSGWLVGGSGNRLVITAGHSLFDFYGKLWPAGTWLHNYVFVGCDNSIMPIAKVAVHAAWADGSSSDPHRHFPFDIGAAVLAKGLINSGNLGVAFNIPPQQSGPWTNVGYPRNGPMSTATGPYAGGGGEGHQIAMSNNDLADGASGGPWLASFQGKSGYANGLLSCRGGDTPYVESMPLCGSPYFGQSVLGFIRWAQANML